MTAIGSRRRIGNGRGTPGFRYVCGIYAMAEPDTLEGNRKTGGNNLSVLQLNLTVMIKFS